MRHQITLYDTLGLERDATEREIRAAFRKLAMQNHPDRYTDKKREKAESKFQEITEAFNVLSRPESREKYDREISTGTDSKGMDRQEIARRLAAKGSQELRDGKVAEALENLKMAIDHDDECARAHYFYGVALGNFPGRERDALRHLERGVAIEPDNATMIAEAAIASLAAGMKSRAVRLANKALDIDPTSAKASRVLHEAETPEKLEGTGLLGKFRRKG